MTANTSSGPDVQWEGRPWGEALAEHLEAQQALQPMAPDTFAYCRALAQFCIDYRLISGLGRKLNWFGFGEVPLAFADDPPPGEEEDMLKTLIWLEDFVEVSGIGHGELVSFWLAEEADDREDIYGFSFVDSDLGPVTRRLFGHSAAMRAMVQLSPWHKEFYEATKELMSHALIKSGLGEALLAGGGTGFTALATVTDESGQAVRVSMSIDHFREGDQMPMIRSPFDDAPEGEIIPIADLCQQYEVHRTSDAVQSFLGPQVSEEEALQMAFRGPTGALPSTPGAEGE
ncbi:hypothetical protein Aph01nite_13280 [Acrocarpospora phusangensis]|uniref:Uncharacterized protein n=1 Tax=Acrocarpospora phusangensis TaxID=1070424 RepID=A0A919Q6V1_9ACTN|nr:hypothetical protein [Acrocarpospora phusangensis]GIH23018.1 hypothetical protein Aph01nite_13280 [Acrocarpospora phusangensis]